MKYAPKGSVCGIHNLYQTNPDKRGRTSWTKNPPDTIEAAAEDDESAQYALILRNAKCYDGRRSLSLDSVVIQSEPLKKFLGKVLEGYPGITTNLERLEFASPFRPLVHRWERLVQVRDEEQDETTKEHVDLFYRVMEEELRDTLACRKDLVRNGVITHDLIWAIFEPDDMIINTRDGRTRGLRFTGSSLSCQTGVWTLSAKFIDFDGARFGFDTATFNVGPFTGTAPITALPVSPLKFHKNKDAIQKRLIAQGKVWEEHKGYHFKQYEGVAVGYVDSDDGPQPKGYRVKSRIIIDAEAFNTFHPRKGLSLSGELPDKLDDEQKMVASLMVHGYSLKDKEWLSFYLDCSKEIEWDSQAFDSLVLPQEQENLKDLILAIAKSQSKQMDNFDDVVQGKGRGIIMQLSGPPGVGKTLTAESVAEVMKVPLYVMSAGDLGTNADAVERSLKNILRMIPKWGAVLLLDEADVFMEARSTTDLQRNELVSIFLRMLEYYEVSTPNLLEEREQLLITLNRGFSSSPPTEQRISTRHSSRVSTCHCSTRISIGLPDATSGPSSLLVPRTLRSSQTGIWTSLH